MTITEFVHTAIHPFHHDHGGRPDGPVAGREPKEVDWPHYFDTLDEYFKKGEPLPPEVLNSWYDLPASCRCKPQLPAKATA